MPRSAKKHSPCLWRGPKSRKRNVRKKFAVHTADWEDCQRCPLGARAFRHVLYRGDLPAHLLFIGEAPGENENAMGEPFIGEAGRLLDRLIAEAPVRVSYGITNIIACWPHKDATGKQLPPPKEAIVACSPRLIELVNMVRPRLIVRLGAHAKKWAGPGGVTRKVLDLVHPSYILRQGGESSLDYKKALLRLRKFLEENG